MKHKQSYPSRCLLGILAGVALLLTTGSLTFASVIDAPHNESGGVKCGDCHRYSLWWTFSPAKNSTTPYNQITDGVCDSCHTAQGFPNKIPHSAESMQIMHNDATGDWSTICIDCHDPHHQTQLGWLEPVPPATQPEITEDEIYLAKGSIDTNPLLIVYNAETHSTQIQYNTTSAQDTWLDPATWPSKTDNDRGLILVVSRATRDDTFEISDATGPEISSGLSDGAGSITVQGKLATSHAGDDFGIFYGQLLKQFINTPHSTQERAVKFFDAKNIDYYNTVGGFVDMVNQTPEGICQVCHTKTDYWLENGDLIHPTRFAGNPDAPTDHNSDSECTYCHVTGDGFQPLNADHTFVSNTGTTCALCHDGADIVTDTHKRDCFHCHSSPPLLISPFPSTKWPTPAQATRATGNCYDCHSGIEGNFTAHPKANDHSGQVVAASNCTTACHFHQYKDFTAGTFKDIINDIHAYEAADELSPPDPATPCDTCHDLTFNSLTGSYSGTGELVSPAVPGPANCTACHTVVAGDILSHPNRGSHSGQIVAKAECTRCHDATLPNPASADPMVDNIHKNMCGYCHQGSTYALQNSALNGPGDCSNCHIDFRLVHSISGATHNTTVTADLYCTGCHTESDLVVGIHDINGCASCHDSLGNLVGSATTHGKNDINFANPNTCSTCHPAKIQGSGHPSHEDLGLTGANDKILPVISCISCHIGDDIAVVHNDNCLNCHADQQQFSLRTSGSGWVAQPAGGTCADCHTALGADFWSHPNKYDHQGQVDNVTGCDSCHDGDPIEFIHYDSGTCSSCHSINGELKGSAIPQATGKPPVGSTDCISCHGVFADPPLHSSPLYTDHTSEVQMTVGCDAVGCHIEPDMVNGIHDIKECATCHADNGSLIPPAIFFGGECAACHTNTTTDDHWLP